MISETVKTYNLTYHNYDYDDNTEFTDDDDFEGDGDDEIHDDDIKRTVILMRTVMNRPIIPMIKVVLVLLTRMMSNNWYMTGLMRMTTRTI